MQTPTEESGGYVLEHGCTRDSRGRKSRKKGSCNQDLRGVSKRDPLGSCVGNASRTLTITAPLQRSSRHGAARCLGQQGCVCAEALQNLLSSWIPGGKLRLEPHHPSPVPRKPVRLVRTASSHLTKAMVRGRSLRRHFKWRTWRGGHSAGVSSSARRRTGRGC
jgi:hypothetical protein